MSSGEPNRIREIRRSKGLTEERLADLVGVTHGHISKLETGKRNLTGPIIGRLCAALQCSPGDLFPLPEPLDDRRVYLLQLISAMSDEKVDTLTALAHALMPGTPYRGPNRRRKKIAP